MNSIGVIQFAVGETVFIVGASVGVFVNSILSVMKRVEEQRCIFQKIG